MPDPEDKKFPVDANINDGGLYDGGAIGGSIWGGGGGYGGTADEDIFDGGVGGAGGSGNGGKNGDEEEKKYISKITNPLPRSLPNIAFGAISGAIIAGFDNLPSLIFRVGGESITQAQAKILARMLGISAGALLGHAVTLGLLTYEVLTREVHEKPKEGEWGSLGAGGTGGIGIRGGAGGVSGHDGVGGTPGRIFNNSGGQGGRQSPGTSGSTGRYTPEKGHDPGNTRGYQHRGGDEQDIPASVGGVAHGGIDPGSGEQGWKPYHGPPSDSYEDDFTREYEQQQQDAKQQQERDDWDGEQPKNPDKDAPPEPEKPQEGGPPPADPGGGGDGDGGDAYGGDDGDFFGPGLKKKGKGTSKTEKGPSYTMHGVLLARLGEGSVGSDESGWDSTHPKANDGDPGGVQPGGLRPKKSGTSASQEESDAAAKKKQNKGLVSYNDGQVEGWEGNHPKMFGIAVGNIRG